MIYDLGTLEREGIISVVPMPHQHILDIAAHLWNKPRYDGHVKQNGTAVHGDSHTVCWSMEDVLLAPHLLEFALQFTDAIEQYFDGKFPFLYSVNAFTTYASNQALSRDTQEFHRDKDDSQFLALFIYLSDVFRPEHGAHQFCLGTHDGSGVGPVETMLGPAGTAFFADTRGLHKGIRPKTGSRSLIWVRWGVSCPPASYVWDKLSPISAASLGSRYPSNEKLQQSIQLVAR